MNNTRPYSVTVPAAPPPLPEGYKLVAYHVTCSPDTSHARDLLDDYAGFGRHRNPKVLVDWDIAIRLYAENGIKACSLEVEAECEVIDEDGEGGAYSATCWWDPESLATLYGAWTPWYNTGDMRSPAVTVQQMIERGARPRASWPPAVDQDGASAGENG